MNTAIPVPIDWLRRRASIAPRATAILHPGGEMTWAELDAHADAAVAGLAGRGVRAGDRVALLLPNGLPFVVLAHAVPRAGAILAPLNTRLSADEVAWQADDVGAALLVHDSTTATLAYAASASRDITLADAAGVCRGQGQPRPPVHDDPDRIHTIIYTSGTTGRPRGAMLTFGNHFWSAVGSALNLGLRGNDRLLVSLPMFHVGGLAILLRSAIYGNPAIVQPSFDPIGVNAAIEDGATIVSAVANMLARMLETRGDAPYPPTLRAILLGGGPAPRALLDACAERGVPAVQTYGLTEAASQVATLAPAEVLRKVGSAGRPLFPTELRIEGASAPGASGEILVRGPTVSPGYWRDPHKTNESLRDGWLHTGDLGYVDHDGYLYVLDRRDDLIVSGGENVYPAEVEAVLLTHPLVAEAGVYGIDDPRWGRVPAADVVLWPGAAAAQDAMIAHCRAHLARYKTPVFLRFVDALPRTASGKLQRHMLGARDSSSMLSEGERLPRSKA